VAFLGGPKLSPGALRRVIVLALFIALGGYALHKYPVPAAASLSNDEVDYQTLAVNLLRGQSYQAAPILPPEEYGFEPTLAREEQDKLAATGKDAWRGAFYRPPGYPVALAIIYRMFGVRPDIVMLLQLVGLVAVAALLPLLGHGLLGWRGFLGGILGGIGLVYFHAGAALHILSEVLICLCVFLVLASWILFQRRRDWIGGIALGASLALALLVKGSLIFLPVFFLGYALSRAIGSKEYRLSAVLTAMAVMVAPVALWSGYATERSGRLVFICTQGPDILLDGNNEYALAHGDWNPQWKSDPNSFYSRAMREQPGRSSFSLVAQFYAEHASYLPTLLRRKLGNAGWERPPCWFMTLLLLVTACVFMDGLNARSWMRFGLLGVLLAALITVHLKIAAGFLLWLMLVGAGLFSAPFRRELINLWQDPGRMGCAFVLLNFLLITLILYGLNRIVWPAYFLLLLLSGYLAIRLLEECETWLGRQWLSTRLRRLEPLIYGPGRETM
jgi:4-amino-4-deoxy-L-arabinose transferase-like glycosyltransferase